MYTNISDKLLLWSLIFFYGQGFALKKCDSNTLNIHCMYVQYKQCYTCTLFCTLVYAVALVTA